MLGPEAVYNWFQFNFNKQNKHNSPLFDRFFKQSNLFFLVFDKVGLLKLIPNNILEFYPGLIDLITFHEFWRRQYGTSPFLS